MNSSSDLEEIMRSMRHRPLEPERKAAVLAAAKIGATNRKTLQLSKEWLEGLVTIFLQHRLMLGTVAAMWMLALTLHLLSPREETLQLAGHSAAPAVTIRELIAMVSSRGLAN